MVKFIKLVGRYILDKLILVKIVAFDYFICRNLFINCVIGIVIGVCCYYSVSILIGPLIGSILTFNLINGYAYYSKYRQWDKYKALALYDVNDFFFLYNMYLQGHRFPIQKIKDKRIWEIDNLKDKDMISNSIKKTMKERTNAIVSIYKRYLDYYNTICDSDELEINPDLLEKYVKYVRDSYEKIIQNTLYASVVFVENSKYLNELRMLCIKLGVIDRYYNLGAYKQDPRLLVKDSNEIILQVVKMIKMVPIEIRGA